MALIASVAAAVAADRRIDTRSLTAAHVVCPRTICRILKEDLSLVKKSQVQKEDRMRISQEFIDAVEHSRLSMLDRIITMEETLVSYFTPEIKRMSKEWTLKGKPGPLKAKVQASRSKQMVFAFFDSRGLIYTHIASWSATINTPYVVDVLGKFWRSLRLKRPELLSQQWFFHWDNAPVHTATLVSDWFDAHGVQRLKHPPYSPDLAPADFSLFRKVKEGLGGQSLDQDTIKNAWEGVTRSISAVDFAAAVRSCLERCKKCVSLGGEFVEKS